MRKLILLASLAVAMIFGWHLLKTRDLVAELQPDELPFVSVHVNPITNVVRFQIDAADTNDEDSQLAAQLIQHVLNQGREDIEAELALRAREKANLYAMLVPYRLRVASTP
ncbi:MAG: hypothetical protein EA370_01675 [Wenzhouxiangella sp.]|nr:MAG: hypothetical protein EA370_01675 [Wenzhouxiangella sp.]